MITVSFKYKTSPQIVFKALDIKVSSYRYQQNPYKAQDLHACLKQTPRAGERKGVFVGRMRDTRKDGEKSMTPKGG